MRMLKRYFCTYNEVFHKKDLKQMEDFFNERDMQFLKSHLGFLNLFINQALNFMELQISF